MFEENKKYEYLNAALIIVLFISLTCKLYPKTDKQIFTEIYETNYWGGGKGSGEGSVRKNAIPFLEYLQKFITTSGIASIVDVGCGDWELMKYINIPKNVNYLGLDLVEKVIADNTRDYARNNVRFKVVNEVEDLVSYSGDLLIMKDVMQHWNISTILYVINNVIPNFKYAILVNDFKEINQKSINYNSDISTGEARPLDLEVPPFSMKLEIIKDYVSSRALKRIYLYKNTDRFDKS